MQIIPATAQDESGIKTLLRACELPADDISAPHLEDFLVIKDAGEIVGSVGLEIRGRVALLRSLALSKSLRGRGMGIQLVGQIETYARSQQIRALYLLTTTADRYFAKRGYQIIPRTSAPAPIKGTAEFHSICPASAVCMHKELSSQ